MPKTKISEYSATANSNTDVASINIDEGCAPSGINNAIRAVMGHLKDFQQGTYGDPFNGPVNGTLGATTASTANVTTLTTSSTVTHSGGTANGVAYLDGSKVLTTGSALTFNGSALAVTGTISSNNGSANNLLSINGDGAIQSGVQFKANGAGPYTTIYFDNATNHTYYKNLASGGHLFFNNSTQAMTLDASGNLLVGTTSTAFSEKFNATQSANQKAGLFFNTNASFTNNVLNLRASRNTTNSSYGFLQCSIDGVADKLYIYDSGNVVNTNNSYGQISDIKLKENIVDATPKLEKLNQVRVVNFNFIGDQQKQLGVVAQELEQVFPGMIDESPDRDAEGNDLGTTTKSVKYSVFVPMLIKAIQEQQAIITQLTARITALEGA